jgi:predicted naringenin-chalcone synthase
MFGLTLSSVATANPQKDARQMLIQDKMELLAGTQNLMQLEIQSHFKRAQVIQGYQMCIQASVKKDDFRVCKMKFKKDQKLLDTEVASLRELNR